MSMQMVKYMRGLLNVFIMSSIQDVNKDGKLPGWASKHVAAGWML